MFTVSRAFGDRAPLMILDLARDPFDTVALSFVPARYTVVANKDTLSTIQPCAPPSVRLQIGMKEGIKVSISRYQDSVRIPFFPFLVSKSQPSSEANERGFEASIEASTAVENYQ
jgi:hypothetical protein